MNSLGPNAGLITNCPPAVNFNTTALLTDICNPHQAQFVGDTGFFLHGNQGGFNVLTCNIKSLDVTYRYFNGSYTLVASAPSDLEQAQRISDGSWAALYYVPVSIEGAGLYSGSYADAFGAKLSLVALSTTTYIIEPTEALQQEYTWPYIGSRIPLAPFLLLFTLAFVYCVSVATITFGAVMQIRNTAYGPEDAKLRATSTANELFGHETAADRLTMAVDTGLPIVRRGTLASQVEYP
ncbi:hypothetical protein B0H14DRAFT_2680504 [Mycena olivaceomarginata]|nr:hypothetical protein B0H14DRAFT_2680504 [Mycena olivaceomarginata]